MKEVFTFDEKDRLVQKSPKKYYIQVWLPNIRKYWFVNLLSLQEAQYKLQKFERNGWKGKIKRYKNANKK